MRAKYVAMTSRPPTERLSRPTRLLAAVLIALAAFGITCLADRWLQRPPERTSPSPEP
jgi:hypothetical protein